MNVNVQSLGFPITAALAAHAGRRLRFALTRHGDRIHRVVVRVGDENGPRGGLDKFCRIQVHLLDAPLAIIKEIGLELYAVIDRATDRVGRVVTQNLDRSRTSRRLGRVEPTASPPDEFDARPHATHSQGETA